MGDIFVSYAAEDRNRARMLAHALGEREWTVWWDRQIPIARTYDDVIEQALAAARCVIVLWSRHPIASEWVRSEASEAKRKRDLITAVGPSIIKSVQDLRVALGAAGPGTTRYQIRRNGKASTIDIACKDCTVP